MRVRIQPELTMEPVKLFLIDAAVLLWCSQLRQPASAAFPHSMLLDRACHPQPPCLQVLEVHSEQILEHDIFERQIGHYALHFAVLVFQTLQPLHVT